MRCLSQAQASVELITKKRYKSTTILSHCRICSTSWKQRLDIDKEARKTAKWCIQAKAMKGTQRLWKQHMTNEELYKDLQKVNREKIEACRTLPQAARRNIIESSSLATYHCENCENC